MTPLKPIENTTRVRGVMADRYPPNEVCAHPECDKPVESVHHIFGRPPGEHSSSWFVRIEHIETPTPEEPTGVRVEVVPHAIGLCGHGTAGHHGDLDSGMGGHQAWIKLEDGVFVWYRRETMVSFEVQGSPDPAKNDPERLARVQSDEWVRVGPLDPQPAGRVKTGKPKRKNKKGEERKKRPTISIAVPQAEEDGGAIWDDLFGDGKDDRPFGRVRARLEDMGVDGNRSPYYVIVDAMNDWLNS